MGGNGRGRSLDERDDARTAGANGVSDEDRGSRDTSRLSSSRESEALPNDSESRERIGQGLSRRSLTLLTTQLPRKPPLAGLGGLAALLASLRCLRRPLSSSQRPLSVPPYIHLAAGDCRATSSQRRATGITVGPQSTPARIRSTASMNPSPYDPSVTWSAAFRAASSAFATA